MPLFNELLHRVGEASLGVHGARDPVERLERWERPASVRGWRAWAEAERAFAKDDVGACTRWLEACERLPLEQPDSQRKAEVDLLWARVWTRLEEPRRALPHAEAAWHAWFGIAKNPAEHISTASVQALLMR
jgi:hypothetical protein